MKKNKTPFTLFLAAVVILLGAILPRTVSWIVDALGTNQVRYTQISAVSLEFDETDTSLKEKLPLLASGERVQVSPSVTVHSTQEIQETAGQIIEQYYQAGLLSSSLSASADATVSPFLVYASYDPAYEMRSNIFWEVTISPKNGEHYLHMILDDQTGTLCTLDYETPGLTSSTLERKQKLSTFAALYLEGLGEEFKDVEPIVTTEHTDNYFSTGADIIWSDAAYGKVRVTLLIYEYGMYIYIF